MDTLTASAAVSAASNAKDKEMALADSNALSVCSIWR